MARRPSISGRYRDEGEDNIGQSMIAPEPRIGQPKCTDLATPGIAPQAKVPNRCHCFSSSSCLAVLRRSAIFGRIRPPYPTTGAKIRTFTGKKSAAESCFCRGCKPAFGHLEKHANNSAPDFAPLIRDILEGLT